MSAPRPSPPSLAEAAEAVLMVEERDYVNAKRAMQDRQRAMTALRAALAAHQEREGKERTK